MVILVVVAQLVIAVPTTSMMFVAIDFQIEIYQLLVLLHTQQPHHQFLLRQQELKLIQKTLLVVVATFQYKKNRSNFFVLGNLNQFQHKKQNKWLIVQQYRIRKIVNDIQYSALVRHLESRMCARIRLVCLGTDTDIFASTFSLFT